MLVKEEKEQQIQLKIIFKKNRDDDGYGEIRNDRFLNGEPLLIGEIFEL